MKPKKIPYLITITFLILSSCNKDCKEEICPCNSLKIIMKYNFDESSTNSFPIQQVDKFKVLVINKNTDDTISIYSLDHWLYGEGNYRQLEIVISGELNNSKFNDYTNLSYYIVNKELNIADSITNIKFNYSIIDCEKQQKDNYCLANQCLEFDKKSFAFCYNGTNFSLDDLPININYKTLDKIRLWTK